MIYPCPYCNTSLDLQPEHIGRRITCPACSKTFIADDLPPVSVHVEKPDASSFENVFKVIIYIIITLIILFTIFYMIFNVLPDYISNRRDNASQTLKSLDEELK